MIEKKVSNKRFSSSDISSVVYLEHNYLLSNRVNMLICDSYHMLTSKLKREASLHQEKHAKNNQRKLLFLVV